METDFDFEKGFVTIVGDNFLDAKSIAYGSENKALIVYNLLYHLYRCLRLASDDNDRLKNENFSMMIKQLTSTLRDEYKLEPLDYFSKYSIILNYLCPRK